MSRKEISPEGLKKLRAHPAGEVELTPEDLEAVAGGAVAESTELLSTWGCCKGLTAPTCAVGC